MNKDMCKEFLDKIDSLTTVNEVLVELKSDIDCIQKDIINFFSSAPDGNGAKIEELYKCDDSSCFNVPRVVNLKAISSTYNQYISGMEVFIEQEFSNLENNEEEVIAKVKSFDEKDDVFVQSLFESEDNISKDVNFRDALSMLEVLIDFRETVNDYYNYAVKFHNMVVSKDKGDNPVAVALIKFFAKSVISYSCYLFCSELKVINEVEFAVNKPNEVVVKFNEIHHGNNVSMNKPTGLQLL